jgi:hypothetical protein
MNTTEIIYGISYKYSFGRWYYDVYYFDNRDEAENWLYTEEGDFRTRELMNEDEFREFLDDEEEFNNITSSIAFGDCPVPYRIVYEAD